MTMKHEASVERRDFPMQRLDADLTIVGGGMSGVCCAITAARAGAKVVLLQDRPMLGGNGSSEVRLWVLGATSHMNSNNRWAREGGVIDELLVENMYRNPEGNPLIFDTVLLEKVIEEPNITLLLNTAVFEANKGQDDLISSVRAFCSQNATMYEVHAPLFCDASGDGTLAFLAGAAFRMGAESREEFGEAFAPTEEYGSLLGHSLYFYSKDVGRPVRFVPPSYALDDITQIPRFRSFNSKEYGCRLWWIEYGGRLDTVYDTERIKWELWKVIYGVWNHIKNSGEFPEAETLTLEWVGQIPGKRESRRFEGPYMLTQQDIIEQRQHDDDVAFGGWSIDLHPADGIFSERPGCNQWHSRGIYGIPYRCLYSHNVPNLFLAGRIISASHVAFGSSRVMATCAHSAQAVGMAAAICAQQHLLPADLSSQEQMQHLQRELLKRGQHIPGLRLDDPDDLTNIASISASSQLHLSALPPDGPMLPLTQSWAQLLPVDKGRVPAVSFTVDVAVPTTLHLELRTSNQPDNHTPDVVLDTLDLRLVAGQQQHITAHFQAQVDEPRYIFYCLMHNEHVAVRTSEQRVTGLLSVVHRRSQVPPEDIGVEGFEFWVPQRRPDGRNFAITISPPVRLFAPENVHSGVDRPTARPNAWVAAVNDPQPTLTLNWQKPQTIARLDLAFDTDFDHAMESVLMGHPEYTIPFCVKHYHICNAAEQMIAEEHDNHRTHNTLRFDPPIVTDRLSIHALATHGATPPAIFGVRCYGPE